MQLTIEGSSSRSKSHQYTPLNNLVKYVGSLMWSLGNSMEQVNNLDSLMESSNSVDNLMM